MPDRLTPSRCLAAALLAAASLYGPTPALAQQTSIYGVLDTFAGSIRTSRPGEPAARRTVVDSGGMQTSFIGIAGSSELGNGLKAVYALEAFLRPDAGSAGRFDGDAFWARTAAVGFEGEFGRATIGRNTTPYFVAAIEFNPLVDSFVVGPTITQVFRGALQGDTAMSNSVRLTTAQRGNWRADLLWAAGDERGVEPDEKRGRAFDGAAFYGKGPVQASLAYRSIDLSGTVVPGDERDQKAWLLGASYEASFAKLFVQYQDLNDRSILPGGDADLRTWQLGASVPLAGGRVLASWANSRIDDDDAGSPERRDSWALGYDYYLSRRTDLYAVFYRDELKRPAATEEQVVALGLRHRF